MAAAVFVAACSVGERTTGEESEPNEACAAAMGEYPPDTILMRGPQDLAVPHTSWSCPGFDSDTFAERLPTLVVAESREVRIEVEIRDDPVFDVRAFTESEQVSLESEGEGDSLTVRLPRKTQRLLVRLCTSDGRCANYEAEVES
ncbi:MAG: hypothetical protein PVG83_13900 [Acidimicrobiia bacterium]|jgi:hypothetical protein